MSYEEFAVITLLEALGARISPPSGRVSSRTPGRRHWGPGWTAVVGDCGAGEAGVLFLPGVLDSHVWREREDSGLFSCGDTIFPFNLFRVESLCSPHIELVDRSLLNNPFSPGEIVPAKGSLKCHFHWGGVSEGRAPASTWEEPQI